MDPYVISLAAGATGLMAMAVGGIAHLGAGGHGHGAHAGHAGHGGHAGHAGHAGHVGSGSRAGRQGRTGEQGASWLQSLLSPRVFFSLLVGFGAGGMLAEPLGEPLRLIAAVVGAAAFETLLVGPLWRLLFRFESRPALTLESAVEDDARAVTGFDASGCGLIALDVDGQVVQLLATLNAEERARGVRVRAGDTVRVSEVDAARGRCVVRIPER